MNKNLFKKGVATLLAATMIGSFSGCKSNEKQNTEIENDYIVSNVNEDNQRLSILLEYDKENNIILKDEKYGYFINDDKNGKFYDVLNNETIDFNNELLNKNFDIYYINFENYYISDAMISSDDKIDYAFNNGISIIELKNYESKLCGCRSIYSRDTIPSVDYKKFFDFHGERNSFFSKYDSKTYFKDNEDLSNSNSLTKK